MSDAIVFIDIDGVLLPTRMWAAAENVALLDAEPRTRAPRLRFDPGCVGLVVRLCQLANAKLVLHSTWRATWPLDADALRAKLVTEGIPDELLFDPWCTQVGGGDADKWDDVAAFLASTPAVRSLVIDDRPYVMRDGGLAPTAQIMPNADEGFGMAEYRAGLAFFEVVDKRVRPGAVAEIFWCASSSNASVR